MNYKYKIFFNYILDEMKEYIYNIDATAFTEFIKNGIYVITKSSYNDDPETIKNIIIQLFTEYSKITDIAVNLDINTFSIFIYELPEINNEIEAIIILNENGTLVYDGPISEIPDTIVRE